MYLQLYTGRPVEHLGSDMVDMGLQGPTLGPFKSITMTYQSNIRITLPNDEIVHLCTKDECVYYDGLYYGDFIISTDPPEGPDPIKLDVSRVNPSNPSDRMTAVYYTGAVMLEHTSALDFVRRKYGLTFKPSSNNWERLLISFNMTIPLDRLFELVTDLNQMECSKSSNTLHFLLDVTEKGIKLVEAPF